MFDNIFKNKFVIIAGACAVENEKQIFSIGKIVKETKCDFLRGGAFKPRTSPYDFQGLGEYGLNLLYEIKKEYNMPIITEVLDIRDIDIICKYVDIIQIGTRNSQNYSLLKELGKINKPIILKRGMCMTINEWLASAEYIRKEGNNKIILCERGIRTFEPMTRNTLDLSCIPLIKELSEYPIIVDPSHATGLKQLILPMSKASIAVGANGVMIEIHPNPESALCDGEQSLDFVQFKNYITQINKTIKNYI